MKKSILLSILILGLFTVAQAQSAPAGTLSLPATDQKLQELITEVQLLRAELQRMNINAYRAQLLLERHKTQQEQVARLTQQLTGVRTELGETRAGQARLRGLVETAEKRKATGIMSEQELNSISAALEDLTRREERLTERELQLASELSAERETLTDLTARLDLLEKEMLPPGIEAIRKKP